MENNKQLTDQSNLSKELDSKYPYINKFVKNLNELNLHTFATSKDDLKTWLAFFGLYINVCNNLESQKQELSEENIIKYMKIEFEKDHLHNYINYVNQLDSKEILFLKNK